MQKEKKPKSRFGGSGGHATSPALEAVIHSLGVAQSSAAKGIVPNPIIAAVTELPPECIATAHTNGVAPTQELTHGNDISLAGEMALMAVGLHVRSFVCDCMCEWPEYIVHRLQAILKDT